jgi:hypothetical protein
MREEHMQELAPKLSKMKKEDGDYLEEACCLRDPDLVR